MKRIIIVIIPLLAIVFPLFTSPPSVDAAVSNCVITKVGDAKDQPVLPPQCVTASTSAGLTFPPNMECKPDGYCKMPKDPAYTIYACPGKSWGAKEMIGTLYTVGKNYNAKYPKGKILIGDITAGNHKTHFWGIAVDLQGTNGNKRTADMTNGNYDRAATIAYGKMIVDTGMLDTIWFNDTVANAEIFAYAKSKYPDRFTSNSEGRPGLRTLAGHSNHFHLNINKKKLRHWAAGC